MSTRTLVAIGMLFATTCGVFAAVDVNTNQDEANTMRQARSADLWFEKWGFKMTRGIINVATCWVELPRCLVVDTMENPAIGPVKGLFKGIGLSAVRAVGGAMDLATCGTVDDTYTVYDQYSFPYFVWQNASQTER